MLMTMRPLFLSAGAFRLGLFAALALAMALPLAGCGNSMHCQSGPKYGTQCYDPAGQAAYPSSNPPAPEPQTTRTSPMPATPAR
jgi:hypothetical protein